MFKAQFHCELDLSESPLLKNAEYVFGSSSNLGFTQSPWLKLPPLLIIVNPVKPSMNPHFCCGLTSEKFITLSPGPLHFSKLIYRKVTSLPLRFPFTGKSGISETETPSFHSNSVFTFEF